MSYEFEGEREYETEPSRDIGALRSSRGTAIVICVVLALTGSGAAFLWREYGGALDDFAIFKSEAAPQAVSLKVFDEYQQAVAGNLRRYSGMLQAQDAEIKRLSDQVLQLTMKIRFAREPGTTRKPHHQLRRQLPKSQQQAAYNYGWCSSAPSPEEKR